MKLNAFINLTLNGYYAGPNGDLSWAHGTSDDAEWNEFVTGNASGGGVLLFGRVTYEVMIQYWPTPQAEQNDPEVARDINRMSKYVASKTLQNVTWNNTKVIRDLVPEVRRLKNGEGPGITILGSGNIVAQLAQENLIDQYQTVINPVALGDGKTLFAGVTDRLPFKLVDSRVFKNGNVVLTYERA